MTQTLRFGILGAARIGPNALLKPARVVEGVDVVAVAARDVQKAKAYADAHGIPRVVQSYEALVNDPELDAIYNPLPNSLHYEWTIKALRAGKHVLCEKPFSSNAKEAAEMSRVGDEAGRVLMEAFHYRYHPLAARVEEILASGVLGKVRSLQVDFFIPLFMHRKDIRFNYALAGGAVMDTGSYCVNLLRWLGKSEPQVKWAQARLSSPQVDRVMHAKMSFENGIEATLGCSLAGWPPVKMYATVIGDEGESGIANPFVPQVLNELKLKTKAGTRKEKMTREPTYNFQLRAFLAATRGEATNITDGQDAVKTMRVIDAIYEKAGLKPRGNFTMQDQGQK